VSDLASRLSPRELAELCALADGTLPAERRAAVEARVAASPELRELLERQRNSLAATGALAADVPPAALAASIATAPRRRRRALERFAPRLALAGGLAVAAAVVAVMLSGGPGGPTVADAARFAAEPASGPAPRPAGPTTLAVRVEGIAFPQLAPTYGWRAVGVRRGRIDGRGATAVFYAKGDRRLAYVIVAGSGLGRPAAADAAVRRGVEYRTLRLAGTPAVTWRRGGHTCVLLGDASLAELLTLASWPLSSPR
jgi:anti-sigma factor RsiW